MSQDLKYRRDEDKKVSRSEGVRHNLQECPLLISQLPLKAELVQNPVKKDDASPGLSDGRDARGDPGENGLLSPSKKP